MKKLFLFSTGMISLFFIGCTPGDSNPNPTNTVNQVDVYVAGTNQNKATYWKNDVATTLTDSISEAHAVVVSGNDVYVAGYVEHVGTTNYYRARYWKNGVGVTLDSSGAAAKATDIKVVGNDVYVCGIFYTSGGGVSNLERAVYWKNGVITNLTGDSEFINGEATSITVVGNDVYVAGTRDSFGNSTAAYWKNGIQTSLDGTTANSIAVVGNDVYVAGTRSAKAVYWKNGLETILNNFGEANAIMVIGNDVFVAGAADGPAPTYISTAKYWKNGVEISLTTTPSYANDIMVLNNVVYAAGTTSGVTTNAAAWINGVQTTAGVNAFGNAIFVVAN